MDCWYKMGEILMRPDFAHTPRVKQRALQCFLKALKVNKNEENTEIIRRVCDIYFLLGEFHKCRKMLDVYLNRNPTSVDYLMLKSFLLTLDRRTQEEALYFLDKANKLRLIAEKEKEKNGFYVADLTKLDYCDIPIIKSFATTFAKPNKQLTETSHDGQVILKKLEPSNEIKISIQKLNIRGLEKFIKDLNDFIGKVCPYADSLGKQLDDKKVEFIKHEIVRELQNYKLIVEFTNAEGDDIEQYISQKINYNIEKIYQAEYEKEQKEIASTSELQKQSGKNTSRVKKRSSKRRSNLHRSDSALNWEAEIHPSQKLDEVKNSYTHKFRKYIDRIKTQIV